jgi:hypothetical protein
LAIMPRVLSNARLTSTGPLPAASFRMGLV